MFHRAHCKRCLEEKLLGFREEFNEWPLGAALYANSRAEVANGEAARMTFYHYDFVDGTSKLNLRGADKMQEIRAMLPTNFAPVVVERTPDRPKLAEARRAMLVAELSRDDFPVPAERVVIGKPVPIGRTGGEATIISLNQVGAVLSGTGFRTVVRRGRSLRVQRWQYVGRRDGRRRGRRNGRWNDGRWWDGWWNDGRWNVAVMEESSCDRLPFSW